MDPSTTQSARMSGLLCAANFPRSRAAQCIHPTHTTWMSVGSRDWRLNAPPRTVLAFPCVPASILKCHLRSSMPRHPLAISSNCTRVQGIFSLAFKGGVRQTSSPIQSEIPRSPSHGRVNIFLRKLRSWISNTLLYPHSFRSPLYCCGF